MEWTGKQVHKWFSENGIETHYIAAKKNKICNNSLKQTSDRKLNLPFDFTKHLSVSVNACDSISEVGKFSVSAVNTGGRQDR